MTLAKRLILWLVRRPTRRNYQWRGLNITSGGKFVCRRFEPFHFDEYRTGAGKIRQKLPWWCPFNPLLHWWNPHYDVPLEHFHDHPRWTLTLVLRGRLIEHTPWRSRVLTPGSLVLRSPRFIHSIECLQVDRGKTWTLFVVGRRKYRQNTYEITRA